ncbi:Type 1 glutamine amidotransferase-like domain-containing protein [Nostoc sp.]|uniref:Type 1 glutamine amidotransferase-like domain-containing protein n=1 Tax=Nostoc sp. TaxID=1180 RepID=UPI002FF983ED
MNTNSVPKQIIAMGGGGFSMEPENPLIDVYILQLSKKKKPKICFIPTASGDSDRYIVKFYSAIRRFKKRF